eukprot:s428_g5.t1
MQEAPSLDSLVSSELVMQCNYAFEQLHRKAIADIEEGIQYLGADPAAEVPVTVRSLSEAHGCANGAVRCALEVTVVHCSELRNNKVADCVVADEGAFMAETKRLVRILEVEGPFVVRLTGFRVCNPKPAVVPGLQMMVLHSTPGATIEVLRDPNRANRQMQPVLANYKDNFHDLIGVEGTVNIVGIVQEKAEVTMGTKGNSKMSMSVADGNGYTLQLLIVGVQAEGEGRLMVYDSSYIVEFPQAEQAGDNGSEEKDNSEVSDDDTKSK